MADGTPISLPSSIVDLFPIAKESVVEVILGGGAATGFIVASEPLVVLTVSHVLETVSVPPSTCMVRFSDGKECLAKLYVWSLRDDFLLLLCEKSDKNDDNRPSLPFAPSDFILREMELFWTISHPLGRVWRGSQGHIRAIFTSDEGRLCFDHNIDISIGSSGSPILDNSGRVVGIQTHEICNRYQAMCMPYFKMDAHHRVPLLCAPDLMVLDKIRVNHNLSVATHISHLDSVIRKSLPFGPSDIPNLNEYIRACVIANDDMVGLSINDSVDLVMWEAEDEGKKEKEKSKKREMDGRDEEEEKKDKKKRRLMADYIHHPLSEVVQIKYPEDEESKDVGLDQRKEPKI